jgi:hypothetical protein
MAKVDWNKIRNEYLTDSTVSYGSLAKKYGVTKRAVQEQGTKAGWPQLRQDFADKAFEQFQDKLLDEKSNAQNRHLLQYQNLQAIINKSIMQFSEAIYYTDKKGNLILDKKGKPIPMPVDTKQLEALAKAAKIAMDGERTVLGLPTSVQGVTDGKGDSVWTGFAEMVKAAHDVKKKAENAGAKS